MISAIICSAVLCLAFANGANDNFKGVATLFGSGTTDYRRALTWATVTTLLGSLTAVLLASTLLKSFTGKGLVDPNLATTPYYGAAVALAAGLTVLIATRVGMPVSTTHGLVGALLGAGWAAGSAINVHQLGHGFVIPLLLSPLIAVLVTTGLYPLLRGLRRRSGITSSTCLCVGDSVVEQVTPCDNVLALQRARQLTIATGNHVTCRSHYEGRLLGFSAAATLDTLHYLSAGLVSFARGLNDTPKIAAMLLLAPGFTGITSTALTGLAIAAGGIISARRVADTMSRKITAMNPGQGFTANLVTGLVVIGASRMGLPVSTTHVSCGSLFGIGTVTRQADWAMMGKILGAWLLTLPTGAAMGAVLYHLLASV